MSIKTVHIIKDEFGGHNTIASHNAYCGELVSVSEFSVPKSKYDNFNEENCELCEECKKALERT